MPLPKKIAIIGTVGIPAKYGGFETLAHQLVKQNKHYRYVVYCSAKAYSHKEDQVDGAKLVYIPLKANGIQSIAYDIWSMLHAVIVEKVNVVLILGVSGCMFLPLVKLFFPKKKYIVNIDGLEWKRDKWSKGIKFFLKFSESVAVKYADKVVTDNQAITDYVQSQYGRTSSLIEYGADHIIDMKSVKGDYSFSVCRIEPENNVAMALQAFSKMPNEKLIFVGNWNNSEYGSNLKKEYSLFSNLSLLDPIYNQEQLDQLRANCKIYVHGHSAGGTNPSLVEAMFLGLPILAFDVLYNKYTTENEALYFSSQDKLIELLNSISNEQLSEIAKCMQTIAKRRYRWEVIALKYEQLFA